jgi:hypothetical protein
MLQIFHPHVHQRKKYDRYEYIFDAGRDIKPFQFSSSELCPLYFTAHLTIPEICRINPAQSSNSLAAAINVYIYIN